MNTLEFLGAAWIVSVGFLTVFAVGAAVQRWLRRRRHGNTLGHIDRYVVPVDVRGLVDRLREEEPRL